MDPVEWKIDDAGGRRGVVGEGDSSGQVNGITLGGNRDSSRPGRIEKAAGHQGWNADKCLELMEILFQDFHSLPQWHCTGGSW